MNSAAIQKDKDLFEKINNILSNDTINYLQTFSDKFLEKKKIDNVSVFYSKKDDPDFRFSNSTLENKRLELVDDIEEFLSRIATDTIASKTNAGFYEINSDAVFEIGGIEGQLEHTEVAVVEGSLHDGLFKPTLHSLAHKVCKTYDEFISIGEEILKI